MRPLSDSASSWRRTLRSFRYAGAGIVYLLRTQSNARFHVLAAGGVVILCAWLGVSATAWAILLGCMGLVLALEAMNTAVEAAVDLAHPQLHPLAKAAKDTAAAAVLIAAVMSLIVGLILLGPRLWERVWG